MGRDAIPNEEAEKYFFHFPDGNSSIARLLVRSLIPEAVPGNSADDIVTSQVRYDQLDQPGSPTRIRLNSTVVGYGMTATLQRRKKSRSPMCSRAGCTR